MAGPEDKAGLAAASQSASTVLDLYKLAVEMADRVSARRGVANTFFLTVNTGLTALFGAATLRWYVPAAGIVFAVAWWLSLRSYRRLNQAKFHVITAVEAQLPVQLFTDEWEYLKPDPGTAERGWHGRYLELGAVERVVPLVFAAIYVAELIRQAID